jgi:hypothetical protein
MTLTTQATSLIGPKLQTVESDEAMSLEDSQLTHD